MDAARDVDRMSIELKDAQVIVQQRRSRSRLSGRSRKSHRNKISKAAAIALRACFFFRREMFAAGKKDEAEVMQVTASDSVSRR